MTSIPRTGVPSVPQKTVDKSVVEHWIQTAAQAADDKKAIDPVILDVSELLSITGAFVIVSASNDRQVKAIAEEIERKLKEIDGPSPLRVEGRDEARWILIDYGDFVVHVFLDEIREFYDLERLWADAPRIEWRESIASGQ